MLVLFLSAFGLPGPANAQDRALLIGIGSYAVEEQTLPGIGKDLELMREVVAVMGFEASGIRVLRDRAATLSVVENVIEKWLAQGVGRTDRVLIYFSGHGSRTWDENGDEADDDQADEVLMMYDARVVSRAGKTRLAGVLIDDRFNELLQAIPSRNILVLLDACHSGTATKAFDWQNGFQAMLDGVKFFFYDGMPGETEAADDRVALDADTDANYVALSAAGDDEEALPSEQGSYFTRGLHRTILQAAANGRSLTPVQIKEKTARFIRQNLQQAHWYNPRLSGNPDLAQQPIRLKKIR